MWSMVNRGGAPQTGQSGLIGDQVLASIETACCKSNIIYYTLSGYIIEEPKMIKTCKELVFSNNDKNDRFDPAIVELCKSVNEFEGIRTTESCQGYIDGHRLNKPWMVLFEPDGLISHEAYCAIEFLAWILGRREAGAAGFEVSLKLNSAAPYLNGPGRTMYFTIEGWNRHPDELAALIRDLRERCFVTCDEGEPSENER